MKKLVIVCCLLCSITVFAKNEKAANYINTYKDIAIAEMLRSGVPASITLAQGILESQYGESDLCKKSNNHFGIKCKGEWTGDKVYHDDDAKGECFRVYATAADSYKDHSDFLRNRPYYTSLFSLDPTDYEGWAKGLKKAGYATEKDYPQRLIKLIKDYDLNQYTLQALQQKNNPAIAVNNNNVTAVKSNSKEIVKDTVLGELVIPISKKRLKEKAEEKQEAQDDDNASSTQPANNSSTSVTAHYPYSLDSVFTINHTKVIYAKEGTSLLSIANKYNIALSKLIEFNDMPETDILNSNQLIFIEKKMKKGASDYHVVSNNESLRDISQTEGVRLDAILQYNNLKADTRPVNGTKIYLHSTTAKTFKLF
jgi:uncharacterized FlgJ-related protein